MKGQLHIHFNQANITNEHKTADVVIADMGSN